MIWYEEPDTTWYALDLNNEKKIDLTQGEIIFSDEQNDSPDHPSSYGVMGWAALDSILFLYDRYDIWKIDPTNPAARLRLTRGREEKIEYRYIKLDDDQEHISAASWLLRAYNEDTKDEFYARFDPATGDMDRVREGPFQLSHRPIKAKNSSAVVFTEQTFSRFPDLLWSPDLYFTDIQRVSEANPQQMHYNWGDIETIHWTSYAGDRLEGLLVKPEDFDPGKKYPMIVNFYELSSHRLHEHHPPAPGRSTINYSYYSSNGYIIFNPDVRYRIGYPGQSAFDAVISGTKAVMDMGFVDSARIALQGHSWGGYQIADILTRSDMFACAEAGAPVVNMISAYGGIRWATGLSRMFNYERQQSRLGATLWERPDLYIENSPIFNLDKIKTPVLIMHNDNDGHVPWYQGIEFFVAMRRLQKPAWLLNYNDEPHWPLKWQNKLDFNRRLFQFFEHYLKDAPMPVWMKSGVPAVKKGIIDGLELAEEDH